MIRFVGEIAGFIIAAVVISGAMVFAVAGFAKIVNWTTTQTMPFGPFSRRQLLRLWAGGAICLVWVAVLGGVCSGASA